MQLYLGGHLNWYDVEKRRSLDIRLESPTLLGDVLARFHVPLSEIAVGSLNGNPIFFFEDVSVSDKDTVHLYPPVDGG